MQDCRVSIPFVHKFLFTCCCYCIRMLSAASESQHHKLDTKLQAAEQALVRNLRSEEESLSHIQKMKRALEAELAALHTVDPNGNGHIIAGT